MSQTQFTEVDTDSFRTAMRELAGGVAVVTVGRETDVTGFTAARARYDCWFASPKALLRGARCSGIPFSA